MCGISGVVSSAGVRMSDVVKMNNLISYRGPDDEGYVLILADSNEVCQASGAQTSEAVRQRLNQYGRVEPILEDSDILVRLGLGHRRLSILDLSESGHQPMSDYEGMLWITYNGEIYNYAELRTELQALGHRFRSLTDTEVILNAYKEWGVSSFSRFIGMWAFVIFDRRTEEIIFSRDRYGIKPFYYWHSFSGDLFFGSEIKQFSRLKGWHPRLNGQRGSDYLLYSMTDHTEETMFKGVFHLPPGCYFKCKVGAVAANRDGRLPYSRWYDPKHELFKGSLQDAASIFKDHFKSAVDLHLRSDVSVGSALSGGLDSSAIVCEINDILGKGNKSHFQKTFSSCSDDSRFSEKEWMDEVVRYTNVEAHFTFPRFEDLFEMTPKLVWHQDEPYQSQSVYLGYHVFGLAKHEGVKVLLNGQGADEYLGGYGQFTFARYFDLLKHLRLRQLRRDIRETRNFRSISDWDLMRGIIYHLFPSSSRTILGRLGGINNEFYSTINKEAFDAEIGHPFEQIPVGYRSIVEISKHLTFFSSLPKYLRWEDRNSMAHSVEARVPFLDHRLVEFCYNLPAEYLEYRGVTKRIMRIALQDTMPARITQRRDKKGFITPEESWVKNHPEVFRQHLYQSIESSGGAIKRGAIDYFDRMAAGAIPFDYSYWRLILFGVWVNRFNVQI